MKGYDDFLNHLCADSSDGFLTEKATLLGVAFSLIARVVSSNEIARRGKEQVRRGLGVV